MGGFNNESTKDTETRHVSLPKIDVGCEKRNRLDRVSLKRPSTKTLISTPHDSYEPEAQEHLYVFRDYNDCELNTDGD